MGPRSKRRIQIFKANGSPEDFSKEKLYRSIQKSGLSKKYSQKITDQVSKEISDGVNSRDIYRKTFNLVRQNSPVAAVHYSLKRAMFEMGPSGHNFELFTSRFFETIGYKVQTCKTIKGKFVTHEVDVVATKDGKKIYVECKFHNHPGIKNDIKIALYVKARWDDLKAGPDGSFLSAFYLASNTSFTSDAIAYSQGTGLNLLGVNAPPNYSFLDQIKELRLYPITSLRRVNKSLKRQLMDKGFILAQELLHEAILLSRMGMAQRDIDSLFEEIKILIGKN